MVRMTATKARMARTIAYRVWLTVSVPPGPAAIEKSAKNIGAQKSVAACQMIPATSTLAFVRLYNQVIMTELAMVPTIYGMKKIRPKDA